MNDNPLAPEIEALLTRYLSIQQQEQTLKEGKRPGHDLLPPLPPRDRAAA